MRKADLQWPFQNEIISQLSNSHFSPFQNKMTFTKLQNSYLVEWASQQRSGADSTGLSQVLLLTSAFQFVSIEPPYSTVAWDLFLGSWFSEPCPLKTNSQAEVRCWQASLWDCSLSPGAGKWAKIAPCSSISYYSWTLPRASLGL